MFEFLSSVSISFLRFRKRPILTFIIRVLLIAVLVGLLLIFTTADKSKIINNLDWFLGCSFGLAIFVSLIAGFVECGRENVEVNKGEIFEIKENNKK